MKKKKQQRQRIAKKSRTSLENSDNLSINLLIQPIDEIIGGRIITTVITPKKYRMVPQMHTNIDYNK